MLIIEGITTGGQATSVTWRRNGLVVDRNTRLAGGGSFFIGGGETIVGTGPCESHMYRVALLVAGRLPGEYTYTVNNANTPTPMTSPVFTVQGIFCLFLLIRCILSFSKAFFNNKKKKKL